MGANQSCCGDPSASSSDGKPVPKQEEGVPPVAEPTPAAAPEPETEPEINNPKVVEEHLKRAKKFFDKMDKDSNGTLEGDELVKLAKWTFEGIHGEGEEPMSEADQQAEIAKLKEKLDANKDGVLSFEEFGEWWNETATAIQAAKVERAEAKREARRQREAEEKAAEEAAKAAAAERWWEAKLPLSPPVVRKEIRAMSQEEQERYANAVTKMMESVGGVPGSSQYFRLACYHGGPENKLWNSVGEFCVHGNEAFPGWHRAYLLEFERVMRCADMALGGDGMIGLPYWGWEEVYINDEAFPKIVRERFPEYPDNLFPDDVKASQSRALRRGDLGLRINADKTTVHAEQRCKLETKPRGSHEHDISCVLGISIEQMLSGSEWRPSIGDLALQSLNSEQHWQHASKRVRDRRKPNIETPHDRIHGGLGGVMGTLESSFHPIFWLHHNNIDRFYQKYIEMHPDSMEEFKAKQAKWKAEGGHIVDPGYPEGPYGTYHAGSGAFKTPGGKDFHAEDCFDVGALGYGFDKLPEPPPLDSLNLQEMPTFAVFPSIEITQMGKAMNLHVFVVHKQQQEAFTPPAYTDEYDACAEYAGDGTIFGLFPPGGCRACKYRKPFDVSVDITGTLRRNKLRKAEAALIVMVENCYDGTLQPLADTPVPAPTIRGPIFETIVEPAEISSAEQQEAGEAEEGSSSSSSSISHAADVEALQRYLIALGYKTTDVVDGSVGDKTVEAIKAFQTAAGLAVDGVVGAVTKAKIVAPQFDSLAHVLNGQAVAETAPYKHGDTVTWFLRDQPGYLKKPAVEEELTAALTAWAPACGLVFEKAKVEAGAKIVFGFHGQDGDATYIFDGPGGCLAQVVRAAEKGAGDGNGPAFIKFDEEEKWLLQGDAAAFGAFRLLPVAIHEIGHVLGLQHSLLAGDVMGPWYNEELKTVSENDVARCKALYPPP